MGKTQIAIGCASAFWGDTPGAAQQLVEKGEIDYLVFDFLAETTMALMASAKMRQPDQGYATDFVDILKPLLKTIQERRIRVLANAGGLNPLECVRQLQNLALEQGLSLNIGAVTGDDLQERNRKDPVFQESVWGKAAQAERPNPPLLCFNAYLGAEGLVAALDAGCDIVVTGRIVDSALALAPFIHHFKWSWNDYEKLAQASLAGHIIECGAQCTGGNFTDWLQIPEPEEIGYPIVIGDADGSFVVTKPAGTGGLVSCATVSEQIVYEIDDPARYRLPNVICDFRQVQLHQEAANRVRVTGAQGRPPSAQYKACGFYLQGYRASALLMIAGQNALIKAKAVGQAILNRAERQVAKLGFAAFKDTLIECLGSGESFVQGPDNSDPMLARNALEIVLRVSVAHKDKNAVNAFCQEIAQAATGMGAGIHGIVSGRPQPAPRMDMVVAMVAKEMVPMSLILPTGSTVVTYAGSPDSSLDEVLPVNEQARPIERQSPLVDVPLYRLAYARSGDKGNHANIGVIARKAEYWPYLLDYLSSDRVFQHFHRYFSAEVPVAAATAVQRWELPGIKALNFLLKNSLGGGGMGSLRADAQGKAFGQQLLQMNIPMPREFL